MSKINIDDPKNQGEQANSGIDNIVKPKLRTWKSLQVSRQHWAANKNIPKEIREKIDKIYFDYELRKNHTPEEIYQEIIHIEVGKCDICGHKLYVGFSCPNILPRANKLPDNPTDGQKLHYNSWYKNFLKGCKERDNSYLIERNKTPKMREASRKVGLKTGAANMKKAHEKYSGKRYCKACGEITYHLVGVGCVACHNKTDKMKKATSDRNFENWKDPEYAKRIASNLGKYLGAGTVEKFCDVCSKKTFFIGNRCLSCYPNTNFTNLSFYKNEDGKLMYLDRKKMEYVEWKKYKQEFEINNETVLEKIKDLGIIGATLKQLKEDFQDVPKFRKYQGNFIEINNEKYIWNGNNRYIKWEDYKKKFLLNTNRIFDTSDDSYSNKCKNDYNNNLNNLLANFKPYPTFRTQDSEDWAGAKAAFDQNLVENDVSWFVYIKFYINRDGAMKPLVVGKSGSLNVNSSCSDVCFSESLDDGPARRFLQEEGYEWLRTHILILKCDSEVDAYSKEIDIANEFGLFQS